MFGDHPLVPGPIVGIRVWRLTHTDGGWRVKGMYHDYIWPVGEAAVARCLNSEGAPSRAHMAPYKTHECGLYATNNIDRFAMYIGVSYEVAMGTARIWGRVIEHEMGFRGSHGYPDRLYVPTCYDAWEEMTTDLAAYNVPVERLDVSDRDRVRPIALETLAQHL